MAAKKTSDKEQAPVTERSDGGGEVVVDQETAHTLGTEWQEGEALRTLRRPDDVARPENDEAEEPVLAEHLTASADRHGYVLVARKDEAEPPRGDGSVGDVAGTVPQLVDRQSIAELQLLGYHVVDEEPDPDLNLAGREVPPEGPQ